MTNEAAYFVRVDDVKQEVAIDFYGYPWNVFESQTLVPKTYSLLASIDQLAKDGQQFAFSLVAVQMHDTGIDVLSEVVGGDFMVMKVAGMGLPIVHSNSPSVRKCSQHFTWSSF